MSKTFLNTLTEAASLQQINTDSGRYYGGANFKYPSVTTVTSLHTADAIKAWRERVGAEEANRISTKASRRGTSIHSLCEAYLRNGKAPVGLADKEMFGAIRPHLDLLDNIHCLETKMVSHKLKVAGTVDFIGDYKNKLAVVDFKTSGKPKQREWVDHYFMQCAAYACMFWEMTDILVEDLCLIIGVDGGECQVFEDKTTPWLKKFRELRKKYQEQKGL